MTRRPSTSGSSAPDPPGGAGELGRHLRRVVPPPEHGAWGLVLEPLALGLAVAPSSPGWAFALAAFAAFLFRQPAKVAWRDRSRGRVYPRTRAATLAAGILALVALAALSAGWLLTGWEPFLPLLAAAPFAVLFLLAQLRKKGRAWEAEVSGSAVFTAVPVSVALAAGWPAAEAWALWMVAAARGVPTVLYVRARLRLERGEEPRRAPVLGLHLLALAGVVLLIPGAAGRGAGVPVLAALATGCLLLRAAWGLSPLRRRATARRVGMAELAWGAVYVVLVVAGYWMG